MEHLPRESRGRVSSATREGGGRDGRFEGQSLSVLYGVTCTLGRGQRRSRSGRKRRGPLGTDIITNLPFTRDDAAEIIGTALTFHYINRMVNVFCEESPFPLPPVLDSLRSIMYRIATPMVRNVIEKSPPLGTSLAIAEGHGLGVLERDDCTAFAGFAGFAASADDLASDQFSADVLDFVREQIEGWDGEDSGFGEDWIKGPTAVLNDSDRPVAQLALPTVFASYRVDDTHIQRFRTQYPGDAPLIVLSSWTALTTARKIGTWLQLPPE